MGLASCSDATRAHLLEQMAALRAEFTATSKRMEEAHAKQIAALTAKVQDLEAKLGRRS